MRVAAINRLRTLSPKEGINFQNPALCDSKIVVG